MAKQFPPPKTKAPRGRPSPKLPPRNPAPVAPPVAGAPFKKGGSVKKGC